jgi:hypothetical protein
VLHLLPSPPNPIPSFTGITLAPHFKNPYAATSLTDFWARRWNITQGLVLRFAVYEPIVEGRLLPAAPPPPPPAAAAAAAGLKTLAAAEDATQQLYAKGHQTEAAQPLLTHQVASNGGNCPNGLRHRGNSSSKGPVQPASCAALPLAGVLQVTASCSELNNAAGGDDCSSSSSGEADTASSAGQAPQQLQPSFTKLATPPAGSGSVLHVAAAAGLSSASQPLLAASSTTIAPRWRRQLAAAATFFVSGLEHELFMAYATHRVGWRWLAFFSLQGGLLVLEGGLKRRCVAAGLVLHPAVASLAVLLVLGLTADTLFCEWKWTGSECV